MVYCGGNMKTEEFLSLRKTAEAAVTDMKDPNLKVKAFEMIFSKLLAGGQGNPLSTPHEAILPPKRTNRSLSSGPSGQVLRLKDEGFFRQPKTLSEVQTALATRGFHYVGKMLAVILQRLARRRELRRILETGKKRGYKYTNW